MAAVGDARRHCGSSFGLPAAAGEPHTLLNGEAAEGAVARAADASCRRDVSPAGAALPPRPAIAQASSSHSETAACKMTPSVA